MNRVEKLVVDPPVHRESGTTIGSSVPSAYGPRGFIEVFSEHYIRVRTPTPPTWIYESEAAGPEKPTGWIPDALIPANALPAIHDDTTTRRHDAEVGQRWELTLTDADAPGEAKTSYPTGRVVSVRLLK